ncbi:ribulose-phosphate 3-epimerase [Desulfovermiculus halophilus]|uniref:ribulose-phosphate 3-epimerase n=1 Tax=Desulfovermiculus halophilus TaxID=339722 RepID=UPI0004899C36|nr:ribulose-phosphate 3-epimerase [Desulfovermiculus halophilus]
MPAEPFILSPSLLSSDFSRLADELHALEQAGLRWAHWDVMDGHFVPNITLGPPFIAACRRQSGLFFDVHLMIDHPDRYVDEFVLAGADLVCVHAEACVHLERTLSRIRELGAECALALNPHTPLSVLDYVLPQLDMVLIMSVNPGFGGQSFIPFSLDKIADLKQMITDRGCRCSIQVDGGVNLDNAQKLVRAGADILVSGSAFFKHPPYAQRLREFLEAAGSRP